MIRPKSEWPADYDATLSMQNAMCEAGDALQKCNGSFPVERYMAMMADVEIWVRIAQVHATNALTLATGAQSELLLKRSL